jgi:hypothetical protein
MWEARLFEPPQVYQVQRSFSSTDSVSHPMQVTKMALPGNILRMRIRFAQIYSMATPRTYEITFAGEAVPAIVAAFEEFEVIVQAGNTTLRAVLLDQPALHGTIDRLQDFGLELLEVRVVARPAAPRER